MTNESNYRATTSSLAPLGMFTPGWDWLNSLEEGDYIDCCDERHTWYRAHVRATRFQE
jgi:hypothetical protein